MATRTRDVSSLYTKVLAKKENNMPGKKGQRGGMKKKKTQRGGKRKGSKRG